MFKAGLVFLTLGLFMLLPPGGRGQVGSENDTLQVEISTGKKCYSRKEGIDAYLKFTNTGTVSIYLYRVNDKIYLAGVSGFDSEGKLTGSKDPVRFPFIKSAEVDDFIELKPGESVSQKTPFFLVGENTAREGEYLLAGSYRSAVSANAIPQELRGGRVWITEDGTLSTPTISITVLKECKQPK